MAADETGGTAVHAATATTVKETVTLTEKVKKVVVFNRDTDSTLYGTHATGSTAAAALAAVEAKTVPVALADDLWVVTAGTHETVFESSRPTYFALSMVGSATDYSVVGTNV